MSSGYSYDVKNKDIFVLYGGYFDGVLGSIPVLINQ
jgi:hypothetical protein